MTKVARVEAEALRTNNVFVRVSTDDGAVGYGECYPVREASAVRWLADFVNEALAPLLIGENVLETQRLWHRMFDHVTARHGDRGVQLHGISGVDIALWDVKGKLLGESVCTLLGGAYRQSIPMYASIGGCADRPVSAILEELSAYREQGFTAFKLRTHWGHARRDVNPRGDLRVVRDARDLLGSEASLGFDANNGYTVSTAIRQGHELDGLNVSHFEEPLPAHDYEGMARVVQAVRVPISAGEQEYTRWQFRDLILRSKVSIIQPDVTKCGGISELCRISALADSFGCELVPHQNQSTLGLVAAAHVMAAERHCSRPQEFAGSSPELDAVLRDPLVLSRGHLEVPSGPGLGVEIDEGRLRKLAL